MVAKVFLVVFSMLQCDFLGVLGGWQGVARSLLEGYLVDLGGYQVVAMVF